MRKIIASLLAVVMVVCAFSVMTVSADAENVLAGATATYFGQARWGQYFNSTYDASVLTDGVYRTDDWGADAAVAFNPGASRSTTQDVMAFTLVEAADIATIVLSNYRIADNRGLGEVEVYVSESAIEIAEDGTIPSFLIDAATAGVTVGDGLTKVDVTVSQTVAEDAPQEGEEGAKADVYFDVTLTLADTATNVKGLIVFQNAFRETNKMTNLDEVEAYGPATADESAPADESSEEEVKVADVTFTVKYVDNGDGTATITAAMPAGFISGKVVINTSADLEYVEGSLATEAAGALTNPAYDKDGVTGLMANVGSVTEIAEGTILFKATFNVAADAEITKEDIIVSAWDLGAADGTAYDQNNGDVKKEIHTAEQSSEAESTVESTVESEPAADSSVVDDDDTPATGDAGIAVFAVLAVISAAAVVVLKKRA